MKFEKRTYRNEQECDEDTIILYIFYSFLIDRLFFIHDCSVDRYIALIVFLTMLTIIVSCKT